MLYTCTITRVLCEIPVWLWPYTPIRGIFAQIHTQAYSIRKRQLARTVPSGALAYKYEYLLHTYKIMLRSCVEPPHASCESAPHMRCCGGHSRNASAHAHFHLHAKHIVWWARFFAAVRLTLLAGGRLTGEKFHASPAAPASNDREECARGHQKNRWAPSIRSVVEQPRTQPDILLHLSRSLSFVKRAPPRESGRFACPLIRS